MASVSADNYGRNDPVFLRYYAAVLTREADARPGSNCQWMRDGASRALRQADELSTPDQGDLFATNITAGESDGR
ncbi:hypothetical protein OIU35_31415 [Boseaceae bacterium BT-24-1]|nr:hypothetical protein [Boseaceae bacterium BT-24-1]